MMFLGSYDAFRRRSHTHLLSWRHRGPKTQMDYLAKINLRQRAAYSVQHSASTSLHLPPRTTWAAAAAVCVCVHTYI